MSEAYEPYEQKFSSKEMKHLAIFAFGLPLGILTLLSYGIYLYIRLWLSAESLLAYIPILFLGIFFLIWLISWIVVLPSSFGLLFSAIPELFRMHERLRSDNGLVFKIDEAGVTYFDEKNRKIFRNWTDIEDIGNYRQGKNSNGNIKSNL